MTGRELIVYILENHLEDEEVFKDGSVIGLMTIEEVAVKLGVGNATAYTMTTLGLLKGVKIGERYYIFPNSLPDGKE